MKSKEEVIKNLEYIFEPISAKVVSLGPSFAIYSAIYPAGIHTYIDILKEEHKDEVYPVVLSTQFGELRINIHSKDLNTNIKHAIGIAYSYSGFNIKDEKIDFEIQKRIWVS